MRVFCLGVYSFLICWFPLGGFGTHFAVLGTTLGFLLGPFGAPWAPKGHSLPSLWPPFGSLGTPWGYLGHLGLPNGAWDDFGSKMDVQFRANGFQVRNLRTKSDLAEFAPASRRERRIPPKWSKRRSSQPHFTRSGGQDDVSLEQTPSNQTSIRFNLNIIYEYLPVLLNLSII